MRRTAGLSESGGSLLQGWARLWRWTLPEPEQVQLDLLAGMMLVKMSADYTHRQLRVAPKIIWTEVASQGEIALRVA
jgi:hypothetical protein